MIQQLPNAITILRVGIAIIVPLLIFDGRNALRVIAFVLFAVAALTDWLDGYLARRWNVLSGFGRMLDPIADKLLIVGCLLALVATNLHTLPILYPSLIILFREVFVSGLREHMADKGVTLHVTQIAKYKTTLQFIAIGLVILYPFFSHWAYALDITVYTFYLAAVLTLYTGLDYFTKALRHV
jgi:CDP-diacylglycerol--glycerol-3-phosphate 3-phosphatidyltransferase